MSYTTYFEIGGHVIESQVESRGQPGRPPATDLKHISKQTGIPQPLLKDAAKQIEAQTGYDPVRAAGSYGRARRARWALSTAAILATADGPIPVGDALAIGFLSLYGGYEIGMAIKDIRQ
jgi:hypothetical protein